MDVELEKQTPEEVIFKVGDVVKYLGSDNFYTLCKPTHIFKDGDLKETQGKFMLVALNGYSIYSSSGIGQGELNAGVKEGKFVHYPKDQYKLKLVLKQI